MRGHTNPQMIAGAGVLVLVLLVATAGMALAWPPGGMSSGTVPGTSGTHDRAGPMGPMGGPGGMMGQGGSGMMGGSGVMGGWGQGQIPTATPSAGVTQIAIQNFAYQPATITIKAGTTVTWINLDSTPHIVTFKNGMKDSGMLRQGQSFSFTFTSAGAYDYYCAYHPAMTGTVTVTA